MKPADRIKEIERLYSGLPASLKECEHNSHMLFLLNRVKRLTEALEYYSTDEVTVYNQKARKALEDEC